MQKEVEIRFQISKTKKEDILSTSQHVIWDTAILEESDLYFCNKELVRTGESKNSPYVVRIRKSKQKNTLTYKSFLEEGSWIEIESGIENVDSVKEILEHLGQAMYLEINKKRQKGKEGDIEINIDEIEHLGLFVELEILTKDKEKGKEKLIKFARKRFSLLKVDIIHKGYVQLMEERLKTLG